MNIENIKTFSRAEAENLSHVPQNTVMISISSPDIANADIEEDKFEDVLYLNFHDSEDDRNGNCLPMQPYHARKVFDFLNKNRNKTQNVYVHCLAGQCRSTGVAYAIQVLVKDDHSLPTAWGKYNRHVFDTMVKQKTGKTFGEVLSNRF